VLGQCSSLTKLYLCFNGIDDDGIAMLRACWPGDSGLEIDDQFDEEDQFVDDELDEVDQFFAEIDDQFDEDDGDAPGMGDGSSHESGQESEEEESGQDSEEED
jgi:hypothetical protein